jgi:hypothetical protein
MRSKSFIPFAATTKPEDDAIKRLRLEVGALAAAIK